VTSLTGQLQETDTAPVGTRWFGTGHSDATDPGTGAAEATAAAVAGRDAALVVVLTSCPGDLPALTAAVRETAGSTAKVIGCTTCGEIDRSGASTGGVAVAALGGPGFSVRIAAGRDSDGRQRAIGEELAHGVGRTEFPHEALLVLGDGRIGRQQEIVRGLYSVLGAAVPLAGACAGNLTYDDAHQFFDDGTGPEIIRGGAVAALIGSEAPIGVGIAHGWRPSGEPMSLTECHDTRILKLDNRPALDVYLERLGVDGSIAEDPGTFWSFAHEHPLGLARRGGQDIRVIQSADTTDRSLTCFADVHQGAVTWLMETDPEALTNGGAESCRQAVSALGDTRPIGVLEFDCAVRKIHLGDDGVRTEIAGMRDAVGGVPMVGFYSMGEIARSRGALGMHHMTSVTLAFG
jgi:hypothetical protein